MFRKLGLAAAAAAAVWSMPAAAQEGPWKVLAAIPDIAIFAGDITGPETARQVQIFIMLPEAAGGIDNSVNRWTIDCRARTALDQGGASYLGTAAVGRLDPVTPGGAESFSEGLTSLVGEYVCDGKRLSADATVLRDTAAARAYGKAAFAK